MDTTRGCALVQQFSVVKSNVVVDRVMFFTGLKPFPGRSPRKDICAVMVSFARGGSVRLQAHQHCVTNTSYRFVRDP